VEKAMRHLSERKKKVFISYSKEDRLVSKRILRFLENTGFKVAYSDYEFWPEESIAEKMGKSISSSDYVFMLLSKNSVKSKWVSSSFSRRYLDELSTRDVTLVPVLIEDCEIPDFFSRFAIFDLRLQSGKNIRKLVDFIVNAGRVDFSNFHAHKFDRLVTDLLKELGFTNVEQEVLWKDAHIDIKAQYLQKDPFGVVKKELWLVETKLFQDERASIGAINQLLRLLGDTPGNCRALLVTNGQLTSFARTWLSQKTMGREVRIIEGPELKNLLLRFPELVGKYFPQRAK